MVAGDILDLWLESLTCFKSISFRKSIQRSNALLKMLYKLTPMGNTSMGKFFP
jgi:hypothetical protein